MTTREELIEAADERMENFKPTERWDSGGRHQKTEAVVDAILAKLSEDYPERESDLAEARSGLIAAQTHTYAQRAIEALDRVIAAGPSVVIVERESEAERLICGATGVSDPVKAAQIAIESWASQKARAEKAEAALERLGLRYEVRQITGWVSIGRWYWCRLGEDGYPAESVLSHGPFFFRFLAVRNARRTLELGA